MPSQSVNPRNGTPFGPVLADTRPKEVDALVARSMDAWPTWAALPAGARAAALDAIADTLDMHATELAELADSETGLGLPRLTGEVARTTFQLRMFAEAVRAGQSLGIIRDPAVAGDPPAGHPDLRRTLVPLGPVAVFGASNFPFAFSVMGGDSASALAAGCTVVAKAHPSHPQTCERVATLAIEALSGRGAPEGTFSLVRGLDAGTHLVQHPAIAAGAFTGSTAGGRFLFDLAVQRPNPIPFYGELGSVNPVIISPVAATRPGLAAEYVSSLCLGAGQFCTNPGLILVPRTSGLAEAISVEIAKQPAGVLLNVNVESALNSTIETLAALPGVHRVSSESTFDAAEGFAAQPQILITDVATAQEQPRLLTTECFGPVGIVIQYESTAEVLGLLGDLEGSLVGTLHAQDDEEEFGTAVVAALARFCGRIVWNGWPTGVAVTAAQQHGGPYPASTSSLHTSVGTTAMRRFQRPIAFQSLPERFLPAQLSSEPAEPDADGPT